MTNEEARALIAQRKAAAQGPQQTVAGYEVRSPEEAADVGAITDPAMQTPTILRMAQSTFSPSVVGGVIGGAGGAIAGKTPTAARAGAAAGTAVGTTFENYLRGVSPFSMENVKDTAINTGISLAADYGLSAASAAAKPKLKALGGKVRSKLYGSIADGAAEMHDIGKTLAQAAEADIANVVAEGGIPMTPDDIARATKGIFTAPDLMESQVLDQAESVARGSFVGASAVRKMDLIRDRTLAAAKKAYVRAVGPYMDDAGKLGALLSNKIDEVASGSAKTTSVMHEFVDQTAGDTPVNIAPIRNGLDNAISLLDKIRGAAPDPQGMDGILASIKELAKRATDVYDADGKLVRAATPFTWREAKQLRTRFREAAEVAGRAGNNAAASEARTAVKNLKRVMGDALDDTVPVDQAGRSVRKVWEHANRRSFAAERLKERAQLEAVIDLAEERNLGAQVVDKLAPKLGNAENLRLTRRLLGGSKSEYWNRLQRWRTEGLLNSNTPERALKLLTEVQQAGPGPAGYREMLGENYDNIVKFLKASTFAGLRNPAGSKVAPHLVEAGLVLSLPTSLIGGPGAAGAALAGATGWVVSMKQLSKWLTSPKTAEIALGLMQPQRSLKFRAAARGAARLIAQGTAEGAIGSDEFIPIPATASRENFAAATGRVAAGR